MNLISFSLWGSNPKYTHGAIRNATLAASWYKGWRCRFYCDEESVPDAVITHLSQLPNSETVRMRISDEPHWSMFWRFYAADDPSVDRVIFRDADSRIGQREAMAVQAWVSSGKGFHVMRDHPQHGTPICGGMWGVCGGKLKDIHSMISDYYAKGLDKTVLWGLDQDFLTHTVWPMAKDDVLEHDEFFAKKPFPLMRDPKHFVGQVYDENDKPQY